MMKMPLTSPHILSTTAFNGEASAGQIMGAESAASSNTDDDTYRLPPPEAVSDPSLHP